MNSAFVTWAVTGLPEVTLKLATSLDGRIATASGESRWISGPESRALVHRWRADSDAVAVGIGTALADDPSLTARDVEGPVRQPARVVFDSGARLPLTSVLVGGAHGEHPVIVLTAEDAPADRVAALTRGGGRCRPAARRPGRAHRRGAAGAGRPRRPVGLRGGRGGARRRPDRGGRRGPGRLVPRADADRRRRGPLGPRRRGVADPRARRRGSRIRPWPAWAPTCS